MDTQRKKSLKTGRCFLSDYFRQKDLELFEKMAIICIRNRLAHDELSLNHMRNLYKRLKCLCSSED